MNGAESLIRTATAAGIDLCLANPGTTEMPLVAALDTVPGVRAVLALFEGVCTGAADGYARVSGRPALTLLHLGPGLANGLANLHNARRARTPVVNVVGDQATWHRDCDAPLTSDIETLARPVSGWVGSTTHAGSLASDFAEALAAACRPPGCVATLIVPADCQWEDAPAPAPPPPRAAPPEVSDERLDAIARRLRGDGPVALLMGGAALQEPGLRAAARVASATRATLFCETFPARVDRGGDLPRTVRLPYFPEQAAEALAPFRWVVLAGAPEPVAFFGYPGGRSHLLDAERRLVLAAPEEDAASALAHLADALGAPPAGAPEATPPPGTPSGALDPGKLGAVLAARQPEHAVLVDEGATSGRPWWLAAEAAPRHSALTLTGGAIGQGLPCATGAALARPETPVIALQADGSGLYTAQALWTQAREGLQVVTVVCANRRYRILQIEMARSGIPEPGPKARALTDLSHPTVDWVALARGFGVPGVSVETADDLDRALEAALREPGPRLIEAIL
ncbi:MAG: acetolactate synthase large subunit [Myxococcota bacterium]|nr:acetolactate synthase large subunit [Myxococcota bacterium]